jgi:hypothetical protein
MYLVHGRRACLQNGLRSFGCGSVCRRARHLLKCSLPEERRLEGVPESIRRSRMQGGGVWGGSAAEVTHWRGRGHIHLRLKGTFQVFDQFRCGAWPKCNTGGSGAWPKCNTGGEGLIRQTKRLIVSKLNKQSIGVHVTLRGDRKLLSHSHSAHTHITYRQEKAPRIETKYGRNSKRDERPNSATNGTHETTTAKLDSK